MFIVGHLIVITGARGPLMDPSTVVLQGYPLGTHQQVSCETFVQTSVLYAHDTHMFKYTHMYTRSRTRMHMYTRICTHTNIVGKKMMSWCVRFSQRKIKYKKSNIIIFFFQFTMEDVHNSLLNALISALMLVLR